MEDSASSEGNQREGVEEVFKQMACQGGAETCYISTGLTWLKLLKIDMIQQVQGADDINQEE
jgi:hypothetical protein